MISALTKLGFYVFAEYTEPLSKFLLFPFRALVLGMSQGSYNVLIPLYSECRNGLRLVH